MLLSSVSHDLRTPLAAITGMATSLRDRATPRPVDETEALDTIVEEAQRLSRLTTNLLSITKVESGAEPRREWVPLEEIVGSALAHVELGEHPVTVDVPEAALAHVDAILVEQLLLNLLENAAKHTSPTTPISVRGTREADRAVLEVADRGPGVPAETRVFDKFVRGRTSASGAGLGPRRLSRHRGRPSRRHRRAPSRRRRRAVRRVVPRRRAAARRGRRRCRRGRRYQCRRQRRRHRRRVLSRRRRDRRADPRRRGRSSDATLPVLGADQPRLSHRGGRHARASRTRRDRRSTGRRAARSRPARR